MTDVPGFRSPEEPRRWPGHMEADYLYTSGVAGERFLRTLRDRGRLTAPRCDACDTAWLPPRLFCEACFLPMETWVDVPREGTVETFTVVHVDLDGGPLETPAVWALIRFPGIEGGLVHRVAARPGALRRGLKVRAQLRPRKERRGSITDIRHFRPVP